MSVERRETAPQREREDAPGGLEALTEEVLPALIARLRASRLGELEVRADGWRIRLRRAGPVAGNRRDVASAVDAGVATPEPAAGSVARSTAVGYFSPAPDLVVGAPVVAGDLLGTIDVLGIAQEVVAPGDGIIARVHAEEGQAVEYGQALADIDPLDADLEAISEVGVAEA